jgi:FAD/FMN-containing dehydrogenase
VTAHQLFDPRFDSVQPKAIAYCASPTDVQSCLAFVRNFGLAVAVRSGGHSYGGYSTTTGLVIDVTRMNSITTDVESGTTLIGAGARLIDVYAKLAQYNLALPAGSCATVGIAGQTLGGGIGVIGRKFGLTCDSLLSAQVVTADGRVLTCDSQHYADLFWALRGGGGGNFGVVTAFTFQAHTVSSLTLFTLTWKWSDAASVLDAWQHWAPQAPDEVWSNCILLATRDGNKEPIVEVNGVYVGNEAALNPLLAQLTNSISAGATSRYVAETSIIDAMLYEAGCSDKGVDVCHLPSQSPRGQLTRDIESAKSDYFTSLLPQQAINNLVNAITQRQTSSTLGQGGIGIDAYGGAINRVASDVTAFVHRNALFSVQYNADWSVSDSEAIVAANHTWLTNTWESMRSYASGAAYQNYIDNDLPNWQQAYYGANFARLQRVKATYDPSNLFHFAQSIPPETSS